MQVARYLLLFPCFFLLAGSHSAGAATRRAARARTAVTIADTAEQPQSTVKSLHGLIKQELERHGIKVNRRPVPRRVGAKTRRLAAYARAHRLRRVYELRLESEGDRLAVTLSEKRVPGLRALFAARLSAAVDQLGTVVPRLVEAVIARKQPRPLVAVQTAPPTQVGASVEPGATVQTQHMPQPAPAAKGRGEFLWGFSLEPGTFLRAAAGLYGGSGKLFYQLHSRPLRFGGEIGGMGGSGRLLSFALRGQYLFPIDKTDVAPLVGAGLSYLMQNNQDGATGAGAAFSASVGVQLSQLSWARLVAETEVVLPMFSAVRQDPENNNGIIDIVRHSSWSPAILFKLSCLF